MKKTLIPLISVLLFQGCGILVPREDGPSLEQQKLTVRNAATTAAYLAITGTDDITEQTKIAKLVKQNVQNVALPVLNNPGELQDLQLNQLLVNTVPTKYLLLMQNAVDLLMMYYRVPDTGDVLDEHSRQLLISFFDGVVTACDLVLSEN